MMKSIVRCLLCFGPSQAVRLEPKGRRSNGYGPRPPPGLTCSATPPFLSFFEFDCGGSFISLSSSHLILFINKYLQFCISKLAIYFLSGD